MSGPRIPPGGRREVGLRTWLLALAAGRISGTKPPNIFLTLGRHRPLFHGWLRFAGRLMPRGKLPRRDTELVILRVAHVSGCDYEWGHHVRMGRRVGLTHEQIERVKEGPQAEGWSEHDRLLLGAVDQLHERRDLDDETWQRVRDELGERHTIELLLLAGHYEMLATVLNTIRVQPEGSR